MHGDIIRYIQKNRVSSTEVADCLGKTGALQGATAIVSGHHRVGRVFRAYAFNESNWEFHEQIEEVRPGDVVLVKSVNCKDRAVFGSLVMKYLSLYKEAAAVVVDGYVRDAHTLIKEGYPLWASGVTPIGCHNTPNESSEIESLYARYKVGYDNAIAVCDDSGVVVIPLESIEKENMLVKLEHIERQEDVWFDCIDRRKWSTYDTVCLKKYENE